MNHAIREYTSADEQSWLRCRVLSFLGTAYFDDVLCAKPAVAPPGLELVAALADGTVVGIMDVGIDDALATIDTVAVHPDHQRQSIGRDLLDEARARLSALGTATLDAWTRDDPDTLRWYLAMGFAESDHFLHVYASHRTEAGEPDRAIGTRRPGLRPIEVFAHASLRDEATLREQFARVHVCRRFAMDL
ncbi:GNAT family N-acetyltransferase [Solihabitans fulvus]|uniref:GNAT family N-acetyltransferase n=1 Tax=Solihabitans fulvus TaxID=1892852 RepID=A0A5B2X7K8_9PSEU|nr:GNAT family N-acetyltransferase [Solihabitans fulvus]KAA2259498.1 GNAT family N-acetyltransferase [Solihabitans fulvus]